MVGGGGESAAPQCTVRVCGVGMCVCLLHRSVHDKL